MNKFVARFRKRNVRMLLGNSVPLGMSKFVDQSPSKFAERYTTKRFVRIKLPKNVVKFQRSTVMMLLTGSATLRMLTNATVYREPFVMTYQRLSRDKFRTKFVKMFQLKNVLTFQQRFVSRLLGNIVKLFQGNRLPPVLRTTA